MTEETEKKKFQISDGEVDQNELLDVIARNADNYAQWRLLKQPGRNALLKKNRLAAFNVDGFHSALQDITTAISEGKLKRGAGNVYIHSDGIVWDDPEHRAALDLVNRGIGALSKVKSETKEKKKYSSSRIKDRFNNTFYGGNFTGSDSDWAIWKDNTHGVSDLASMILDEINDITNSDELDYEGSPYKNRQEHLDRLTKLHTNLTNGTLDESDVRDWIAAGGDGEFFRNVTHLKPAEKSAIDREWELLELTMKEAGYPADKIVKRKLLFYEQKLHELDAPFYDTDYNENWNNFASSHWINSGASKLADLGTDNIDQTDWRGVYENEGNNKPGWIERSGNAAYADKLYKEALTGTFTNGTRDGYTNKHILRMYMYDLLALDPTQFTKIKDGEYFINNTFDLNTGSGIKYNTKTRLFIRVYVDPQKTPILLENLKKLYSKLNPYNPGVATSKWGSFNRNGGTLNKLIELRNGGNIQYALSGAELAARNKQRRTNEYNASVKLRAIEKGISEERIKAGDVAAKSDNSFNSLLRNVSTGFDVVGAGASFIPVVGNGVGAVLGTIGTLGHLAADAMDDSVTSEEMWTNAAINGALTGLMLLPGGGTASLAGKAIKGIKTGVLVAMPAYAGYQTYKNWDRMKELREKEDKGILSHEERRELDYMYSMAAGAITGGKHMTAKAAPHIAKISPTTGKVVAGISDPITGALATLGNRKAKLVVNDMIKSTKPIKVQANDLKKGLKYKFVDANGKSWEVNAALRKAMLAAEEAGRKAGLTGKELDTKIGEAWASNHEDASMWYSKNATPATTTTEDVTWNPDVADKALKSAFEASTTPTGELELAGIKFSKESVIKLKEAYNKGKETVNKATSASQRKIAEADITDDMLAFDKHAAGIDAAKAEFLKLAEAKKVTTTEAVEGSINPNAPVFGMEDTSTLSKHANKLGLHNHALDFEDMGSSALSRWVGSGEGYRFNPNSPIGRRNATIRMHQRQHAKDLIGNNRIGDWLLDHFNTNWEMAQGMSGIRNRTDRLLDALAERHEFLNSKAGRLAINKQNIFAGRRKDLEKFELSRDGHLVIKDLETTLGRKATELEKFLAMRQHQLQDLRDLSYVEQKILGMKKSPEEIFAKELKVARKLLPEWRTKSLMSDDKIKSIYNRAKATGYTGTLSEYALYLKDLQNSESTKLGRPVALDEIVDSEYSKYAHSLLALVGTEFTDSHRAVEIARSKYKMTGSDFDILNELYLPHRNSVKRDILTLILAEQTAADEISAFRKSVTPGHKDYNSESKVFLDRYKHENASKIIGLSEDDIIHRALALKKLNQTIVDLFLQNRKDKNAPELSEGQLAALDEMITSGIKIKNHDELNKRINQVKAFEDAEAIRVERLAGIDDLFNGTKIEAIKARTELVKRRNLELRRRRITSPTRAQRLQIDLQIKEQMYDEYLAKIEALKVKEARRLVREEKQRLKAELLEQLDAARKEAMALRELAANDVINLYEGLSDSEKLAIKKAHRPLSKGEAAAALQKASNKRVTKLTAEQRADILEKAYQRRVETELKKILKGKQTKSEQLLAAEEAYNRQIAEILDRRNNAVYDRLEADYRSKSRPKDFESRYTALLLSMINDNKHLLDGKVTVGELRSFVDTMLLEGENLRNIAELIKNPNVLSHIAVKAKYGIKLLQLKSLRNTNFSTDNSYSSNGLSKFLNGGIMKFENPALPITPTETAIPQEDVDWYTSLWSGNPNGILLNLERMRLNQNASFASGANHNEASDLSIAAKKNNAYISNPKHVLEDIQHFYNNKAKGYSALAFVDYYNQLAQANRDFYNNRNDWQVNDTRYPSDVAQHNDDFKLLFNNRTNVDNNDNSYIGWDENLKSTYGTNTHMRRMDLYRDEFEDLVEKGYISKIKERIHEITLGDGSKTYVYKKANGDIGIVDNDLLSQLNGSSGSKPEDTLTYGSQGDNGSGSSGDDGGLNKSKLVLPIDLINSFTTKISPNKLALIRLAMNLRNNRKLAELAKLKKLTLLLPKWKHRNTYGNFAALLSATRQGSEYNRRADEIANATTNQELGALAKLEAQMKNNDTVEYGRRVDNAKTDQTREASNTIANEVYDYNHKVSDEHMARFIAKHNYNLGVDEGELSSKTTSLNNASMGHENELKIKQIKDENKAMTVSQNDLANFWEDNVINTASIQALREKARALSGDSSKTSEYNATIRQIQKEQSDNVRKYNNIKREWTRRILSGDYNWRPSINSTIGEFAIDQKDDYPLIIKRGAKIIVDSSRMKYRADDLKELRKLIKHNINTNQKALDNLSKATLLELKKMMGI